MYEWYRTRLISGIARYGATASAVVSRYFGYTAGSVVPFPIRYSLTVQASGRSPITSHRRGLILGMALPAPCNCTRTRENAASRTARNATMIAT